MKEYKAEKSGSGQEVRILSAATLENFTYSINTAGGGGNIKELLSLIRSMGSKTLPLTRLSDLQDSDAVVCVARLGSPGAKADNYANKAAGAPVVAIEKLCEITSISFPVAVAPVEATAGQMARAIRSVLAANKAGKTLSILDVDICGGSAVPSIPLAFNIGVSLKNHPQLVAVTLESDNGGISAQSEVFNVKDPFVLEDKLRKKASLAEMGAVWFAWMLMEKQNIRQVYTEGALSSSFTRGALLKDHLGKNGLLEELPFPDALVIAQGRVTHINDESGIAPGFFQARYSIKSRKRALEVVARNEYITVSDGSGEALAAAPYIINMITSSGPVQSHMLKEGMEVAVVVAKPQWMINNPSKRPLKAALQVWNRYWRQEQRRETWPHPYEFIELFK
jgi:DUF917 family protein